MSYTLHIYARPPERRSHSGSDGTSALSIWLSVDPMADKYPSTSPYTYCANNPVKLVDPDGRDWWIPEWSDEPVFDPNITKHNCPNTGKYLGKECDWQRVNLTERTVYNCHGTIDGSCISEKLEVIIKPQNNAANFYHKNGNIGNASHKSKSPHFFSDNGAFMSFGLESLNEMFPQNIFVKCGTKLAGGAFAGLAINETWKSNNSTTEKVFDTGTNIVGLCGWPGLIASTTLQLYKRAAKFFIEYKQGLDSQLEEMNSPGYWYNW